MPNWFYTDANGMRQGLFDDQQLRELVAQGIITPDTPMETDTGHKGVAGQIPGLFPAAPPPFVQPAQVTSPPSTNVFCTNCGNPVSEQAVACMSCGARPTGHKKFCRQCGVALNPEQVVCVKCGAAITTSGGTARSVGGESADDTLFEPPFDPNVLFIGSIIITFCCCLPAGIVGIIFTNMCKQDLQEGRYKSAKKNFNIALWTNVGGLVGGLIIGFFLILGSM